MTKRKVLTKQLGLLVILFAFFLGSCATETIDEEDVALTRHMPEWLKGDYMGVHTQFPLTVNDTGVAFAYLDETVFISIDDMDDIIQTEVGCTVTTASDLLLFNKTTVVSEINFRYNDLNLGWFVKIQE